MNATNRATAFSRDLKASLEKLTKRRPVAGITEWQKNWPMHRDTVDVVGRKGARPRVLIEVELRREDPSSNVVKIWKWISDKELPKNAIVLQAFSKVYKVKKQSRKARATFVAERMMRQFRTVRYRQVPFGYNPTAGGKVGGGARQKQAHRLATKILSELRKLED